MSPANETAPTVEQVDLALASRIVREWRPNGYPAKEQEIARLLARHREAATRGGAFHPYRNVVAQLVDPDAGWAESSHEGFDKRRVALEKADKILSSNAPTSGEGSATSEGAKTQEPEQMYAGEDGWSYWIHPIPGYLMHCCGCGMVHEMQTAIVPNKTDAAHRDPASLSEGEGDPVTVFRMRLTRGGEGPVRPAISFSSWLRIRAARERVDGNTDAVTALTDALRVYERHHGSATPTPASQAQDTRGGEGAPDGGSAFIEAQAQDDASTIIAGMNSVEDFRRLTVDALRKRARAKCADREPDGWIQVKVNNEGGIVVPYGRVWGFPDPPHSKRRGTWAPFYLGEPR